MLILNLKNDIWTGHGKMSYTQFCTLKFDLMSTPLPQQDLINQVGELTSGRGTEKCSIIMCQPHHPPTGRQQIGDMTLGRIKENVQ